MSRRKSTHPPHVRTDAHWEVSDHLVVNGRHVEAGTEVKIADEPGRFTFRRLVHNPATGTSWIDVFGGDSKHETLRSFRPDRIQTVHRLSKRRENAA